MNAREQKFAAAEGLLNHIEDHLMLHGSNKLRMQLIADIVRVSEQDSVNTHAALERQNKELREALEICLGHLTGGMDGNWADCDPAQKARAALAQALPDGKGEG